MSEIKFKDKIISADKLALILAKLKEDNKKIVYCHGVFDLLHRGHIGQFEQARSRGDILVIGLTTDNHVLKGPGRPVFNQNIRAELLAALELVDFVTFSDADSAAEIIKLLKPNVYVKGQSYEDAEKDLSGKIVIEVEAVKSVGGEVFFSVEMPIRSTPLLNNFIDPYPEHVLEYLAGLKKRYSFDRLVSMTNALGDLKVLVIGEPIIDQYDYVEAMDSSPKGGVITLRHLGSEIYPGGSLACANHIANLCSDVTLLASIGEQDQHESYISRSLNPVIKPLFLKRNNFSTLVKRREVDRSYFQKRTETYLLFDDRAMPEAEEREFLRLLARIIRDFDLIFVIDYGHGMITDKIVKFLSERAPFLAVNTQANSANKGLHVVTKYPKADYACLDNAEAIYALRDKTSEPRAMGRQLLNILGCGRVMITLGHRGSVIVDKAEDFETPIFSKKIVDTVGAGDALFSATSLAVASDWPLELTGFLGNVAGALATTYIGNKSSVTKNMLFNFIHTLMA